MQASVSMIFAGDACMKKAEEKLNSSYAKWVLEKIQPTLDAADFRVINLENPLTDLGEPIVKSGPALKGTPECAVLLTEGKFDCAVLANNHIGDYGEIGVLETLRLMNEKNIATVGGGKNIREAYLPWYAKKEGKTIGILAVCENEFGIAREEKPGAAGFEIGRLQRAIAETKKNADWVVVIIHGGTEDYPLPSPRVKERYHLIADLGADAIIGMHPHCPQGTEYYHGVPIVYSVGNFFFYDAYEDISSTWYFGYLPKLIFTEGKPVDLEIYPYHFTQAHGQLLPLEGAQRRIFDCYLAHITEMFADDIKLKEYFQAWSTITGGIYADFLKFTPEFTKGAEQRAALGFAHLRNDYTCEAHNELLTTFLLLLEEGDWAKATADAEEIKALQFIHIN